MEWDADFWERVVVTLLGTSGSLLVALLIFFLTRLFDRRRARREHRVEALLEFSDSIGELLRYFLNISITPKGEEETRAAVVHWMAKSFRFQVALGTSPIRQDFERASNGLGRWFRQAPELYKSVYEGRQSLSGAGTSFKSVADDFVLLQHKVNVLIVGETIGRREARRAAGEMPFLDADPTVRRDEIPGGWQAWRAGGGD